MTQDQPLVGRGRERAELERAVARAREGRGELVLLAGEAGVGKTRLAHEILAASGLVTLRGGAGRSTTLPFAPVAEALRSYARVQRDGLPDIGPLVAHLALLLPELGPPSQEADRAGLAEAIRLVLVALARRHPTAIFLDDLQWADSATLELLPPLAGWIEGEPVLVVAAYRNDEIPRGHPLRRMRIDLRRAGRFREMVVEPLTREETGALAEKLLGQALAPVLTVALYDRTQGVPFFVEELTAALAAGGLLRKGPAGLELAGEDVPLPDTVRDAVLLRAEGLSDPARKALEVAAVAGLRFDVDMVFQVAGGGEGLEEAIERGLILEPGPGLAAFRHALAREAHYGQVPWSRRRALHRQIAAHLEDRGAPSGEVAEHWLAAREFERGRQALLASVEDSRRLHAYRDAARAARRAVELWPEGEDEPLRLAILDRLAHCAELSGELAEAARAWEEVAEGYGSSEKPGQLAGIQRKLAAVYELQGLAERALAAHQAAAEAFESCERPVEAAEEHLAAAERLHRVGRVEAALEVVAAGLTAAARAGRVDLEVRAAGLEGQLLAGRGEIGAGLDAIRKALGRALEQGLTEPAADLYYRLADTLDLVSHYGAARDVYREAVTFCREQGLPVIEQVCLGCLAVVLRQSGEWDEAAALCRDLLGAAESLPPVRAIAGGMLGSILALRGEGTRARGLLREANAGARRNGLPLLEVDTAWSLAVVDELEGADESAAERCRRLRQRWAEGIDRHYAILPMRWAATFFAMRRDGGEASACASALADMAVSGAVEALAGLAHALGECALLEGDAAQAVLHFDQSLQLLHRLETPFQRAETLLRAGVALAAAGERQSAVERLSDAYRIARKLRARPLATRSARELAALGEPLERRMGRRAAGALRNSGLSAREVEVLRLIGLGRTNREIARGLVLSPRTVEMHVSHILTKLDCSTRTQATHRGHELGILP